MACNSRTWACSCGTTMKIACTLWLAIATVAVQPDQLNAQTLGVTTTKVGSPIWKPADFQMFTAPAAPFPDAFFDTLDALLPLEGPGTTTYTPHQPPYDTELSTNAAAAGFVQQTVFSRDAITLDPNGVYLAMMWLPDPGITGSSRDFASGPVIPNSLFPFTSFSEIFLDGVKVETLQDQMFNIRAGDVGFDGASHRAPSQVVWHPWADDPNAGPLGDYEIRWQLRDIQGNGWNIVAGFKVVPEPSALVIVTIGAVSIVTAARRKRREPPTKALA
ncbi:MAG TPA: PEP-CTERM sorting domain-containing protein [Lacipirellulaceae bacterium]|nr:PEP-CTERM sorting domain-containing protein [Lacipirellulaceae bacterium]